MSDPQDSIRAVSGGHVTDIVVRRNEKGEPVAVWVPIAKWNDIKAQLDRMPISGATYSEVRDAVYEVLRHPSTSFCTPDVLTARVMEALRQLDIPAVSGDE